MALGCDSTAVKNYFFGKNFKFPFGENGLGNLALQESLVNLNSFRYSKIFYLEFLRICPNNEERVFY